MYNTAKSNFFGESKRFPISLRDGGSCNDVVFFVVSKCKIVYLNVCELFKKTEKHRTST